MRVRLVVPFALALLGAVASCAHAGTDDLSGAREWQREIARRGVDPDVAVFPFATTPEMERWASELLDGHPGDSGLAKLVAIQEALFDSGFDFAYDSEQTLTAAEAFELRRGNCMSFTALFVAMARSAGIRTFLMSVRRDPEVDRDDDLVIVNRHVVAGYRGGASQVTVFDFYITTAAPYVQRGIIDDVTATAMYHTNLGAEAIREGALDRAIRNLEIATALAPDWAPGWVNLGVALARSGSVERAFDAYGRALEAEPQNSSALANLALLYRQQGLQREAETALRAAAHQTTNPFTLIAMADSEMMRGRFSAAARYLRKARWWYGDEAEVYDAMARLAALRGNQVAAAKHGRRAAELRASQSAPED
jgi:Flp pilus assembly protein TadD